jgi:integrase/recombinase XerD
MTTPRGSSTSSPEPNRRSPTGNAASRSSSCPHPNACHSCPHFLTDERYRPVLQEQLERAEQRVNDAERAGHERLAEINRPDALNLRRIIAGLDRLAG